ncbi:hypothetical protein [Acetobacter suratthaniensis]|uniref:hypothetical protein n=1 Tax=Acetobacter suratthaniensis TaxID=1502841 RepID=UPI002246FCDB|nr:hypothetical protein [Acetobacter suratthaniensis]
MPRITMAWAWRMGATQAGWFAVLYRNPLNTAPGTQQAQALSRPCCVPGRL